MQSPTMGVPTTHAFNPRSWLRRFEAAGGGYALTSNLWLFAPARAPQFHEARTMAFVLQPGERHALHAHLASMSVDHLGGDQ